MDHRYSSWTFQLSMSQLPLGEREMLLCALYGTDWRTVRTDVPLLHSSGHSWAEPGLPWLGVAARVKGHRLLASLCTQHPSWIQFYRAAALSRRLFICYTIISFNSIFKERNIGEADCQMLQMVFFLWPLWTSNSENLLKTCSWLMSA